MGAKKSTSIFILHGWGLSGKRYNELKSFLKKEGYDVFSPDFPGFGDAPISDDLHLSDYVQFLHQYIIKNNKNESIILIGHSFGGRVIAKFFGDVYPQEKNKLSIKAVVLSGTPLVKRSLSLRKKVGVFISKVGKGIFMYTPLIRGSLVEYAFKKLLYRFIGEWDYYKSGALKQTFINITSEELDKYIPTITVPTLILWGEDDTITPLEDARKIAGRLSHAKLVVIAKATHKLPYEYPEQFAQEVIDFINTI